MNDDHPFISKVRRSAGIAEEADFVTALATRHLACEPATRAVDLAHFDAAAKERSPDFRSEVQLEMARHRIRAFDQRLRRMGF
jgi:hypothetical protein